MTTTIEILSSIVPPLRWVPEQREFTREFLLSKASKPDAPSYSDLTEGQDSVLCEAQRILGRCLPPGEAGRAETGLVVGYVQSGKTLSFETVIALARDNGYGLVIILAGTKNNLRDQSEERLKADLGIEDGGDHWFHLSNPNSKSRPQVESRITAWLRKPTKKSLIFTVLKHESHIAKLATLLGTLDLASVPTLIIDDESDQASLNTWAAKIRSGKVDSDTMSATYLQLRALRSVLPHHSYLQYTATPQGLILLAQSDFLNPDFAEVITPGNAYTGGKSFFLDSDSLTCEIPAAEVPSTTNRLSGPPQSLLSAFRHFLLVAAHHSLTRDRGLRARDRNRSMMVHPAMATTSHKQYKDWVDKAKRTLRSTVESLAKTDLAAAASLFQVEYNSLKVSFPGIRPLDELILELVDEVFLDLNVVEINSTPEAEEKVNWKQTRYWILVGASKLDRGYTVEGLCVTYMPRPLGTSAAADSLQQRARFFGYKAKYLGLCRVFLQSDVRDAFHEYVEHEEFVREALVKHRGLPLRQWRRDFILSAALNPTRSNVIGLVQRRIPVNGWMVPRALHWDVNARVANRELLLQATEKWSTVYARTNASAMLNLRQLSPHDLIRGVPLSWVIDDFLAEFAVREPRDAEEKHAIEIFLTRLARRAADARADIVLMNRLVAGYRTRTKGRGVTDRASELAPINQYFSQSANGPNDSSYRTADRVTLQLRRFNLGTNTRDANSADIRDVAWFALHIPASLRNAFLIEERR